MARKRKRRADSSPNPAKSTRTVCSSAWGYLAKNVTSAVDWKALADGFDVLTQSRHWAHGLTHSSLSKQLVLRAEGAAKLSLLAAVGAESERAIVQAARAPSAPMDASKREAAAPHFVLRRGVVLRHIAGKGRGWVTRRGLPAGAMVLVEKPLVAVLDDEWQQEEWSGCRHADSAALSIHLAHCLSPSLVEAFAMLHPPEAHAKEVSASDGSSDSEEGGADALEAARKAWLQVDLPEAEKVRLRAAVRLNALGFYTHSEQICHTGSFASLNGSGIFALGSGFNHSCVPQVSYFALGNIVAFVTNRAVRAGEELCINYIETELLCTPTPMRQKFLNRDFTCGCQLCNASLPEGSPPPRCRFRRLDDRLQERLPHLPASRRVKVAEAALNGEVGSEDDESADSEETETDLAPAMLLGSDAQQLRVVQAHTLMELRRFASALAVWRRLAAFTCHHCPPFDEALCMYATHAALCKFMLDKEGGSIYVAAAVRAHRIAFGAPIFRWRYRAEVEQSPVAALAKRRFWSACDSVPKEVVPWHEYVASWCFASDEIPDVCYIRELNGGKGILLRFGARPAWDAVWEPALHAFSEEVRAAGGEEWRDAPPPARRMRELRDWVYRRETK